MIRTYRAELTKLVRPKVVAATALLATVFSVAAAKLILAAENRDFTDAGGGTEVFRVAVSFTGTFLFVIFAGTMATEFGRGTVRTMLLRQSRRLSLLAGRLAAVLTFAAVTLAYAQAVTWVAARVQADNASRWTSVDGLVAAAGDFGAVLVWVTGYAVLGTALAVVLRSVPLTLGVGIAWAGPVEHIIQDAWTPAGRFSPGLLLEAFAAGGTDQVTAAQALGRVVPYCVAAAMVAAFLFARRDVTT